MALADTCSRSLQSSGDGLTLCAHGNAASSGIRNAPKDENTKPERSASE